MSVAALPADEVGYPFVPRSGFGCGGGCAGDFEERGYDLAALWVAAGWKVRPIQRGTNRQGKKRGPYVTGEGSDDLDVICRWFVRWPFANVGVMLDGQQVVVLDVDGPDGERELGRLAALVGGGLPDTYEVITGRVEEGRHLYYRLPDGCPPLANQTGSRVRHPGLDVKFRGYMLSPGAMHHSRRLYWPLDPVVPRPSDLTELPGEVYEALAAVGRVWAPPRAAKARSVPLKRRRSPGLAEPAAAVGPSEVADLDDRQVERRLSDVRDGRDARIYSVVVALIAQGRPDEEITAIVLESPLGQKASERGDPYRYVRHKIDSVRSRLPARTDPWDASGYWEAVHRAGLNPAETRVLDHLLSRAWRWGYTSESLDLIGINSALTSPDGTITDLLDSGWLEVLVKPPPGSRTPRWYRLLLPKNRPWEQLQSGVLLAAPRFPLREEGSWVFHMTRHDAFRLGVGSLHPAYNILGALVGGPQTKRGLVTLLGRGIRTVQRDVKALVDAGLVVDEDGRCWLAEGEALPRLDAVARAAGTHGLRERDLATYRDKNKTTKVRDAAWGQRVNTVGTPEWRQARTRDLTSMNEGSDHPLLVRWLERGGDLPGYVEKIVADEEAMPPFRRLSL